MTNSVQNYSQQYKTQNKKTQPADISIFQLWSSIASNILCDRKKSAFLFANSNSNI